MPTFLFGGAVLSAITVVFGKRGVYAASLLFLAGIGLYGLAIVGILFTAWISQPPRVDGWDKIACGGEPCGTIHRVVEIK